MKRLILTGEAARKAAHREVDAALLGWEFKVGPKKRGLNSNAALHATLTDVSKQLDYFGRKRSKNVWKGIFVSGWEIATGRKPEILPGLEGEFINIRESTTDLSDQEIASLIEYITAYGIANGVLFKAREEG